MPTHTLTTDTTAQPAGAVEPTSILDRHLSAFAAGDLDALLADYSEESVMITQEAVYHGRDAIGGFFRELLSGLFQPGTYNLTMDVVRVVGSTMYIAWHASCATAQVALATDTFQLQGRTIAVQTFAAKIDPR